MIPVICVVGRSGTGKTTVMEKLIREMKGRGYRVAVLKHTKDDAEWDHPEKDSWRLSRAGSDMVLLGTPQRVMTNRIMGKDVGLEGLMRLVGGDFDIVLAEGFHESNALKIEVHRKEAAQEMLAPRKGLMAVITDEKLETRLPQFALDDVREITDFIESKLLTSKDVQDVGLFVNGVPVRTSFFVQDIISRTLKGMISSLKGVEEVVSIDIWVREKQE